MGLFSFVGGLIGSGSAKKASRRAERATIQAIENATAEQRRQFDLTRGDFEPFREVGLDALGPLASLIGTGTPEEQAAQIERLKASPLYQSLFGNGLEALTQTAAATGGLRGGNMVDATADFGRDTLAQVIQQQIANLGGLAGMGQNATGATAEFGQRSADNISSLMVNRGQARSSGLLTRGGINAQNWQNAGGFLDSVVQAAMGAGAGPGGAGFNAGAFAKSIF